MIDTYSKVVLTFIALALGALALSQVLPRANAQMIGNDCGQSPRSPCYISVVSR